MRLNLVMIGVHGTTMKLLMGSKEMMLLGFVIKLLANCSRWQTMSDRPTSLLAKTLRWKKRPGNQNRIKMRMFNKVSTDMKKRKFSNSNLQLQKLNKTSRKIIISTSSMKRPKLNNLKIRHRSFRNFKKKNHSWRNLNYMRKK